MLHNAPIAAHVASALSAHIRAVCVLEAVCISFVEVVVEALFLITLNKVSKVNLHELKSHPVVPCGWFVDHTESARRRRRCAVF